MRFSLNSGMCVGVSCGSDDSSAFRMLVQLKGKYRCQLLYLPINNFQFNTENLITKLRIHDVTIYNGNVDEIENHSQIKSEFAFMI